MQPVTHETELPQILQDFKTAYDNKDYEGIANLFAEKAQFQGTAESEYREVLRADVTKYFQNIGEARISQNIELIALNDVNIHNGDGRVVGVEAVFHSVAPNGDANPDKPIKIGMELNCESEIVKFKSEPREP